MYTTKNNTVMNKINKFFSLENTVTSRGIIGSYNKKSQPYLKKRSAFVLPTNLEARMTNRNLYSTRFLILSSHFNGSSFNH